MPHQFKNDGSGMIPKGKRILYTSIGVIMLGSAVLLTILFGFSFGNTVQFLCGLTIIWGIKFNGFYKMFRWYAEYQLKKKDNLWRR